MRDIKKEAKEYLKAEYIDDVILNKDDLPEYQIRLSNLIIGFAQSLQPQTVDREYIKRDFCGNCKEIQYFNEDRTCSVCFPITSQPLTVDKDKALEVDDYAKNNPIYLLIPKNVKKAFIQYSQELLQQYKPTKVSEIDEKELERVFGRLEEDSSFSYDFGSLMKGAKVMFNLLKEKNES